MGGGRAKKCLWSFSFSFFPAGTTLPAFSSCHRPFPLPSLPPAQNSQREEALKPSPPFVPLSLCFHSVRQDSSETRNSSLVVCVDTEKADDGEPRLRWSVPLLRFRSVVGAGLVPALESDGGGGGTWQDKKWIEFEDDRSLTDRPTDRHSMKLNR